MNTITVNGEPREAAPDTLRQLVEAEGLDPDRRGLAVARNGRVVPRQQWERTELEAGDAIEIVKPFAGG
ncbi:thiamine biosynthesis protein ThiS [Rhodovibrio sodomensis]|uniref:Thiamine biosynthesis protein ThiS n=1 Tax=Rhodovibrio sodomensis TaxID=1088 RepID=A0ABS1DC62_9PROT|nr:sulfur carrier protein ThiS [Rhodovibrio sodomensis]MBK1667173.1 thiamine biosynthesis protein ThiS [Rhodovibrio sodomensis]